MENTKQGFTANFYETFCQSSSKYFGGWFIVCKKEEMNDFLSDRPQFNLRLRHLVLYLESAEILKTQIKQKEWSFASLYSKQLWFQTVLLLLVGLIDQSTSHITVKTDKGEQKLSLCKRFLQVMNSLDERSKHEIKTLYFPKKNLASYEDAVWHICASRNFFAHEFDKVDENTPADASMSFSPDSQHGYVIHSNLPHGKLFAYILMALFAYLEFPGALDISTGRSYEKLVDFLSDEA